MPNGEVVIDARGVGRRFGDLEAVRSVDLEISRGEVFGVLGPNGAGKSTLMRMMVGMLEPSAGSIEVLGARLPQGVESVRERIGYMTQRFSLYEDLSVEENLEFACDVFGLDRRASRLRLEELLEQHELAPRREQRAGTLSGGWKQRLALAAATVHHPEIVLLDEPTAGVDPHQRRVFWQYLFDLAADGVTVLVSTHYMDEAVRCHRLCLMRDGRRAALGTPSDLLRLVEGRVLTVTGPDLDAASDCLRSLDGIASVAQIGSRLSVLIEPGLDWRQHRIETVEKALESAGLEGTRAERGAPTLEDLFVAVSLGEGLEPPPFPGGPE